jgi:hypothetical protein
MLKGIDMNDVNSIISIDYLRLLKKILLNIIDYHTEEDQSSTTLSESALNLFISSLKLLYPSFKERQFLLQEYIHLYIENKLSKNKCYILELLMKQISESTILYSLIDESNISNTTTILSSLMVIYKKEMILQLSSIPSSNNNNNEGIQESSIIKSVILFMISLYKIILSKTSQKIILLTNEGQGNQTKNCSNLFMMVIDIVTISTDLFSLACDGNDGIINDKNIEKCLNNNIEKILKLSPVGQLLPTMLHIFSLMLNTHSTKMIKFGSDNIDNMSNCFQDCRKILYKLVKLIGKDNFIKLTSSGPSLIEKKYESQHPYDSNINETTNISFPGASKLVITFDPSSKTEVGADYLVFNDAKTGDRLHKDRFTGRHGSQNWPGCDGRPPLELNNISNINAVFCTDGSVEDYGYVFTVTAYMPLITATETHWLVTIDNLLIDCICALSNACMLIEPHDELIEENNAKWMEHELISKTPLFNGKIGTTIADTFLVDLISRPRDSLAEKFSSIIKRRVIEDQGSDININKVVYATCAVLLKFNDLVSEAISIAKGIKNSISPALLNAWKNGQQIRSHFLLENLRQDESIKVALGKLSLRDSDNSVIDIASIGIIEKVMFLLRSPAHMDNDINENIKMDSIQTLSLPLSRSSSINDEFSPRYLAKEIENKNYDIWKSENEVVAVNDQIKKLNKKKYIDKNKIITITEKILAFIKNNSIEMKQLENLNIIRNNRCNYRTKGLQILTNLVKNPLGSANFALLSSSLSMISSIRNIKKAENSNNLIHYSSSIEGCSVYEYELLQNSFRDYLFSAIRMLFKANSYTLDSNLSSNEINSWKKVVIEILSSITLDYDFYDHNMLDQCSLLPVLEETLDSKYKDIIQASESTILVLINRCLLYVNTVDNQSSLFSQKLALVVSRKVNKIGNFLQKLSCDDNNISKIIGDKSTIIVPKSINIGKELSGYTFHHFDVKIEHSISIQLYRDKNEIFDINNDEIQLGTIVMRGKDWKLDQHDDGGVGELGVVTQINDTEISVKWNKSEKTGIYIYNKMVENNDSIQELSIASPSIGGHIYSKGAPGFNRTNDDNLPSWCLFGLRMLPNATINVFISNGLSEEYIFNYSSNSKINPDEWTRITVVQDGKISKLYINDILDAEMNVDSYLINPNSKINEKIIESCHPYENKSDLFELYDFPNAAMLVITFDDRSMIENFYDYIKFYKDDKKIDYYGSDKYCGKNYSSRNFPGTDGNPPLIIPSNKFYFSFVSDGSDNAWGYKFTVS